MATATGGDILLTLMQTVAELRVDMRAMQDHAKKMQEYATKMGEHARRSDQHLARFGKVLGMLAKETRSRLDDHEQRISKLEHA